MSNKISNRNINEKNKYAIRRFMNYAYEYVKTQYEKDIIANDWFMNMNPVLTLILTINY